MTDNKKAPVSSAQKIAPLIIENTKSFNSNIKKQIILTGLSRVGKTTLLNSLRGASYKITSQGLQITNPSFSDGGKTGEKGGGSCTLLPNIQNINGTEVSVCDGPGHGDTRNEFKINDFLVLNASEIKVMGSILMEITNKKAESTSVVLVLNYQKFLNGIKDMQENGEMISRLFKNIDSQLPIFIVFNRFHSDVTEEMETFLHLKGKQKLDFVHSKIKEEAENINKMKKDQADMEYFDLIYNNIKKNNFEYIDIQDEEIINILRTKFQSLPPFPNDKIFFDNSSEIRVEFNNLCRANLINFSRQVCQSQIKLLYPIKFLNNIMEACNKSLTILSDFIKKISKEKKSDENHVLILIQDEITKNKIQTEEFNKQINESGSSKTIHENKIKSCQNNISKLEKDIKTLNNSIESANSEIDQLKQTLNSKISSFESDSRQLGNIISNNNSQIRNLTNSLESYEEKDSEPVCHERIYKSGRFHNITAYFSSEKYHDPNYTKIVTNKPRIDIRIINDSPNYCQIKFEKGGGAVHMHPEIDVDVYLYAKKKYTRQNEYSSIRSNIERCHSEIHSASNQIAQINNDISACQQRITNSINQKKTEKKNKEKQLNSIIVTLNSEQSILHNENSYLANQNAKISSKKNEISLLMQNLNKLKKDEENIKYALSRITYFQNIKNAISEHYKLINSFPDYRNDLPKEISSIIIISEILKINENEITKIRTEREKEKMLIQNPSIFTFELINNVDNFPDKINFISPGNKKEMSFEDFHKKLVNDINSLNH